MDDILIYSPKLEEHLKILKDVFQLLLSVNMTIKQSV